MYKREYPELRPGFGYRRQAGLIQVQIGTGRFTWYYLPERLKPNGFNTTAPGVSAVASLWIFTPMPVSVCPVFERLSRAPPRPSRPRVRATPAPHGGTRSYRRKNGPQRCPTPCNFHWLLSPGKAYPPLFPPRAPLLWQGSDVAFEVVTSGFRAAT